MGSARNAPTNFVGGFFNDNEENAEFAGIIRVYSDRKVAKAAEVTEETVRLWKAERRFPQGHNLMRLMAEFPKIAAWVNRRTGGVGNPQSLSEGFAFIEKVMASNTADGRAIRARLEQMIAEDKRG